MCVCVCVRERERKREKDTEREITDHFKKRDKNLFHLERERMCERERVMYSIF